MIGRWVERRKNDVICLCSYQDGFSSLPGLVDTVRAELSHVGGSRLSYCLQAERGASAIVDERLYRSNNSSSSGSNDEENTRKRDGSPIAEDAKKCAAEFLTLLYTAAFEALPDTNLEGEIGALIGAASTASSVVNVRKDPKESVGSPHRERLASSAEAAQRRTQKRRSSLARRLMRMASKSSRVSSFFDDALSAAARNSRKPRKEVSFSLPLGSSSERLSSSNNMNGAKVPRMAAPFLSKGGSSSPSTESPSAPLRWKMLRADRSTTIIVDGIDAVDGGEAFLAALTRQLPAGINLLLGVNHDASEDAIRGLVKVKQRRRYQRESVEGESMNEKV